MSGERLIAVEHAASGLARAALVIDGRLEDLLLDGEDETLAPETIHWARVDRVVPAIGAAFVRLEGGAQGWLRSNAVKPGAMIMVQVQRWAEPGKAVPVTERLLYKGRLGLLTPGAPGINPARGIKGHAARERLTALGEQALGAAAEGTGLVLRTAAADAEDDDILAEIAALRDVAATTAAEAEGQEPRCLLRAPDAVGRAFRDWASPAPDAVLDTDEPFERLGLWDEIEALTGARAPLPRGGGHLWIEATRALVAVDVNTGDNFAKGAAAEANLAACAEILRQLRLRGLGGLVTVDFAPVKKGARQGIDAALKRAVAADPVETQLGGWTPMGRFEMSRKRERRPLAETIDAHR
jgi:Ribonuclease G/E